MRVLLADDHALFRAGIASLLEAWGMEVVGQASDGREAVELARWTRPDLVLMDITMPNCNGLEATRLIKSENAGVKIVMVTVSDHDSDLFEAIKAGAEGYLLKDMSEADFSTTLAGIAQGEPALSGRLAARILGEFVRRTDGQADRETPDEQLTEREREVLTRLAEGETNREIAERLVISEHTVSFHVKNILAKLHLKNRAQAAAYAIRAGLAPDEP
ncbi:MAG TPA: response regulator transcription factor [Gaiellaceae bacterium]|nr:response regulator transcription factor [Gaiellaceae bacterium]